MAFVIGITGAAATKANLIKVPGAYTGTTGSCVVEPEPLICQKSGTIICTVSGVTYYIDNNCLHAILYGH
jgi:hypothetical protein